MTGSDISF